LTPKYFLANLGFRQEIDLLQQQALLNIYEFVWCKGEISAVLCPKLISSSFFKQFP
jgi:hypothetical protein